ncbi:MAG: response regulator transcription factor [Saprospiraceae bacterium]
MNKIRVTIFEDNHSLRNGLSQLIDGNAGYECVGAFEDCSNLFQHIEDTHPDVILMDIEMPGISGIEAVKMLREKYPEIKILMQTIFEENEKIFQSIFNGASGYILKNTSSSRILEAITETFEGGAPMSPSIATKVLKMVQQPNGKTKHETFNLSVREIEILSCLVKGMSYKLIADVCFISIDTVRGHIRHIYDKLHVHSKSEAVVKAIKGNIV